MFTKDDMSTNIDVASSEIKTKTISLYRDQPFKYGSSQNNGTPKSSIKIPGFPLFLPSILGVNTHIYGNIHISQAENHH